MSAVTPPTSNQLWGLFALASLIPLILFRAFVLLCLWSWFIVPLGVPAIGMGLAMGLNITASYFTHKSAFKELGVKKIADNEAVIKEAWSFPAFILFFGFIFSFFV